MVEDIKRWTQLVEPRAAVENETIECVCAISMAISLKRLADVHEKMAARAEFWSAYRTS